ncbi:MAG: CDP-archaeol synthase [Candidatus Anstonellaceae archaeon]
MEALLSDILLLLPMHMTNDLTFLMTKFNLAAPLKKYNIPVSAKLFGSHRTYLGYVCFFAFGSLFYFPFAGANSAFPGLGIACAVFANSFVKRRLGLKPGAPFPPLDQLDFFFGASAGLFLAGITFNNFFLAMLASGCIHASANACAYIAGIKKVWW